jgi:choline kinase
VPGAGWHSGKLSRYGEHRRRKAILRILRILPPIGVQAESPQERVVMKAIILAAGRGSRMENLTEERPKCLVELRGKPLLDWQLEALNTAGISEVAIVTGYKRELLSGRGLTEFHNPRWAETNMVSSLACAQHWLQAEQCIVSYSDIFYSPVAVTSLMDCHASLAVTYDPNWLELWTKRFGDPLLDAETFRLTTQHTLVEIGNKPKSVAEVQGQYMGLLRFTPKGWSECSRVRRSLSNETCDKMHMTGMLQMIIDAGRLRVEAVEYIGAWGEVDSGNDLQFYEQIVR